MAAHPRARRGRRHAHLAVCLPTGGLNCWTRRRRCSRSASRNAIALRRTTSRSCSRRTMVPGVTRPSWRSTTRERCSPMRRAMPRSSRRTRVFGRRSPRGCRSTGPCGGSARTGKRIKQERAEQKTPGAAPQQEPGDLDLTPLPRQPRWGNRPAFTDDAGVSRSALACAPHATNRSAMRAASSSP